LHVRRKILGSFFCPKLGRRRLVPRVSKFATSRRRGSKPSELYRQWSGVTGWVSTCLWNQICPQLS